METRSDEIAAEVPLPEEPEAMGSDQPQGWITEEAFFTVPPGARQVRQRKEVKMGQLTPAEKLEFLKSMDTEWQTLLKNQAAKVSLGRNSSSSRTLARSSYLEARRQHAMWTSGQSTTHQKLFHRS